MKTFIEDYKNSPYYSKLFEVDQDVIIVYAGGSRSFRTSHEKSDYDINIVTKGGTFFSVYYDWHLKYKGKTVHWYYRPIEDFFDSICYDIIDYVGLLTLLYIPQENIIYLNPKYEKQWEYFYNNREQLLYYICIELGLSCKNLIETIVNLESFKRIYAQRAYFIMIAAYYFLNRETDFSLLKRVSLAKKPADIYKLSEVDFLKVKELLLEFSQKVGKIDLFANRQELKNLKNKFSF